MTMSSGDHQPRGPGETIESEGDEAQRLPYTQPDLDRARRSSKVAETVAREILTDIVNRQLKPGHLIGSEAQMLERYRVARGSLREALRLLEVHGLIYIRAGPSGGAVVGAPTMTSFGRTATMYLQMAQATMGELHEALIVIEPVLVRYAAVLQNPVQLAALNANKLEGEEISLRDDMAYRVLVGQFHDIFTNTSGNRLLDLFTGGLRSISTHRLGSAPVASPSAREQIVRAHAAITDAIFDRRRSRSGESYAQRTMRMSLPTARRGNRHSSRR